MNKKYVWWIAIVVLVLILGFGMYKVAAAAVTPTPSTNEINHTNGWARVDQSIRDVGSTTLAFTNNRVLQSCFEYRTDGDVSQKTSNTNYNTEITDGLYPYTCVNNTVKTKSIIATGYVEVRMVFGAEKDERFDWTRFDVDPVPSVSAPTPAPVVTSGGGSQGGHRHCGTINTPTCVDWIASMNGQSGNSLQQQLINLLNQLIALLQKQIALQ